MTMGARGPNEGLIGVRGSRHQLGTPSLVIDVDIMDANIASLAEHAAANNYEVRPVGKIHKSIEINPAARSKRADVGPAARPSPSVRCLSTPGSAM